MLGHIQKIVVVPEAEVPILRMSLYKNGFPICTHRIIAKLHPFIYRHSIRVTHIVDPFLRVLFQQDLDKPAQILHMEKLQLHAAITGDVEFPPGFGALKDERLTVYILHGAVQIRRTQDISMRNCLPQKFFRSQLVGAIVTPMDIRAAILIFRKRLGIGFWVNSGR